MPADKQPDSPIVNAVFWFVVLFTVTFFVAGWRESWPLFGAGVAFALLIACVVWAGSQARDARR